MGRLAEADEQYRVVEGLCTTALERADATLTQVLSLTQRSRLADGIGLGLSLLHELGITVPAADHLPTELDHQFEHLYRWLGTAQPVDDPDPPEMTDARPLAA